MKNIITLFLLISVIIIGTDLRAEEADHFHDKSIEEIKRDLPKLTGVSNVGTSFWFTIPPCYEEVYNPNNFIKIFVTSPYETQVVLEIPGKAKYDTKRTIANDVIVFDITPNEGQPYKYNYSQGPPKPAQIFEGSGIHITSDDPVVIYVVVRYQYTSDGFLAIPENGLGNQYIAAPYSSRPISANGHSNLPNMLSILATQDNTLIDFELGGNDLTYINVDGGADMYPGQKKRWRMDEGDVIVIGSIVGSSTLAGSGIVANKPIAVLSGHYCADIPVNNHWCDYNVEMDLPAHTWGKHYHVPKVKNRINNGVLRIYAKDDNTIVYRDGLAMGVIPKGGGGTINNGWLEMRTWPVGYDPKIALYSASGPITITYYNPGIQEDQQAGASWQSDPFSMVLTPIEQYQNEITFCTPATRGGLNFSENYLMMVYEADDFGLPPGDLEFGTVEGNTTKWEKVGTKFAEAPAVYYKLGQEDEMNVETPFDGKTYGHLNIELPADGVYRVRGSQPFAVYAYGYDSYDSYGYPTSAALRDLSVPDTVPPMPFGVPDCTGDVFINFSDMPDEEEYRSNMYDVIMDPIESFNYEITSRELISGQRTGSLKLEVIKKDEDAKAVIVYLDRAGNDTTVTYEYFAPDYTLYEKENINPVDLQNEFFGDFELDDVNTRTFVLENQSDNGELIVQDVYLTNAGSNFEIDPVTKAALTATPFAPLEKREFDVTFTAVAEGFYLDSIGVQDECGAKTIVEITAAVGTPIISAEDVAFGTYILKETGNQPVTKKVIIWNNECQDADNNLVQSRSVLRITGYSALTNPAVFSHNIEELHGGPVTEQNPLIIPQDEKFEFEVEFLPDNNISYTDQIVFTSNATECDPITYITGEATEPSIAAVGMDWQKRRIVRQGTPFARPDYDPELQNGLEPITVANTASGDGATELVVQGIQVTTVQGAASQFNFGDGVTMADAGVNAKFANLRIQPDNQVTRPVYFSPTQLGPNVVEFSFTTQTGVGEDDVYTLAGHGVVPNLNLFEDGRTEDDYSVVNFGQMTVGNDAEIKSKTLVFTNSPTSPQNGDVLTITNITYPGMSDDGVNWGAQGYRFDIQADIFDQPFIEETDFPITLEIGESLELNIEFNAPDDNGLHPVTVTIESDAYTKAEEPTVVYNNTLVLNGEGLAPTSVLVVDDLEECVGNVYNSTAGQFTFGATGSSQVTITDITITPDNYLTITNLATLVGTTLNPGDAPVEIEVEYAPTAAIPATNVTMQVETDALPQYQPAPMDFTISTREYTRQLSADWSMATDRGRQGAIEIGDRIKYDLNLDGGADISEAGLQNIEVQISYKNGLLKSDMANIELGPDYAGGFEIVGQATEVIDPVTNDAVISINIASTGGEFITAAGTIVSVYFDVWLPSYAESQAETTESKSVLNPVIEAAILNPGNKCAALVEPNDVTLTLDESCVFDLRPIVYSGSLNGEAEVTPNPVQGAGQVNFSLAIGGQAQVNIYDQTGKLIERLHDGELSSGSHSLAIPVDKLNNGTYIYEIVTSNYQSRDKFVVSK